MIRWSASIRGSRLRASAIPVILGAAFSLSAGACASEQDTPPDGARLTTRGAGELLTSGTQSTPAPEGFEDLSRPPPSVPPREQITLETLGVDFGNAEAPVRILELFDFGCGFCRPVPQGDPPRADGEVRRQRKTSLEGDPLRDRELGQFGPGHAGRGVRSGPGNEPVRADGRGALRSSVRLEAGLGAGDGHRNRSQRMWASTWRRTERA